MSYLAHANLSRSVPSCLSDHNWNRSTSAELGFIATMKRELANGPAEANVTALVERLFPRGWLDLADAFGLSLDPESGRPFQIDLTPQVIAAIAEQANVLFEAEGSACYADLDQLTSCQTDMAKYVLPDVTLPKASDEDEKPQSAETANELLPDEKQDRPNRLKFLSGAALRGLPPQERQRVCGDFLERGSVSLLAGLPGAGKSLYAMSVAVSVAAGKTFADDQIDKPSPVIFVNNEDDIHQTRRRMIATIEALEVDEEAVLKNLYFLDSDVRFLVASAQPEKAKRHRKELVEMAKEVGASLIIIDPLVECHEVDENDNGAMSAVAGYLRQIARKSNAAVLMIHHAAKNGVPGDMNSSRGASAVTGVVRACRTLFELSERDLGATDRDGNRGGKNANGERAIKWRISPEKLRDHIRLDDAKLNYGRKRAFPYLFVRKEVTVGGELVGTLTPLGLDDPEKIKEEE